MTAADIAAFAHVVGESEAAKKLFCRGPYTVGESAQPESAPPVVATAGGGPIAAQPAVMTPAATETTASTAKTERANGTVPLPAARPSGPRR
jgi:hypothetical protein